jgi:hypothetical protein
MQTVAQFETELIEKRTIPTVEVRDRFLEWLDSMRVITANVFYAIAPDECWEADENSTLSVTIPVNSGIIPDIPQGAYCIMLPDDHIPDKYRDPVALAFAHLGKKPEDVKLLVHMLRFPLPKPTAHERLAAKMFFKKLILDNPDNEEIKSWATQLN